MTDRELMQQALEDICGARLCEVNSMSSRAEMLRLMDKAAKALRQALAQPVDEPVAMRYDFDGYGYQYIDSGSGSNWQTRIKDAEPLYTAPPKKEWVGLTDEEIYDYADKFLYQHGSNYGIRSFGKAIEAKLKEKNGG